MCVYECERDLLLSLPAFAVLRREDVPLLVGVVTLADIATPTPPLLSSLDLASTASGCVRHEAQKQT